MTYKKWIRDYLKKNPNPRGFCNSATSQMTEVFPELRKVRGFVTDGIFGRHQHWWCETEGGDVIDPTEVQFAGALTYQEYDPKIHGPEPIGKCMNCGDYCYEKESPEAHACSDECYDELVRYYG